MARDKTAKASAEPLQGLWFDTRWAPLRLPSAALLLLFIIVSFSCTYSAAATPSASINTGLYEVTANWPSVLVYPILNGSAVTSQYLALTFDSISEGVYNASSNANQSADFTPESTAYTYQDFAANSSLATWQELVNFTDASVGARSILSVSTIFPNGANLTFLWDYFNASGTYSDGTSDTTAIQGLMQCTMTVSSWSFASSSADSIQVLYNVTFAAGNSTASTPQVTSTDSGSASSTYTLSWSGDGAYNGNIETNSWATVDGSAQAVDFYPNPFTNTQRLFVRNAAQTQIQSAVGVILPYFTNQASFSETFMLSPSSPNNIVPVLSYGMRAGIIVIVVAILLAVFILVVIAIREPCTQKLEKHEELESGSP